MSMMFIYLPIQMLTVMVVVTQVMRKTRTKMRMSWRAARSGRPTRTKTKMTTR